MTETEKAHTGTTSGPQKGVRIRKNPSVVVKFRLSHEVYSAYEEEAKKAGTGSVSLLCQKICAEWWPSVREYRIREAMKHFRHASKLKFTPEEMKEAKERLVGEL